MASVVDEREPLPLVLAQEPRGLLAADALVAGDERHGGHDVAHEGGGPLLDRSEPQVTVGHDADQLLVAVDDREAGDTVLAAPLVEALRGWRPARS